MSWERNHLRTVVDLQRDERLEIDNRFRQLRQLAICDTEGLELLQEANLLWQRGQTILQYAMVHVELLNSLRSALLVDNLRLALALLVKSNSRRGQTLLHQGASARLRHLDSRVNRVQICTLVVEQVAHTLCMRTLLVERRVVHNVGVVVGTKFQNDQLGELSDCRREVALEAEVAQVEAGNTAIGMYLHTRLLAPQIDILVEVPICATLIVLAIVAPVRTIEALPNFVQRVVVLDILIRLV